MLGKRQMSETYIVASLLAIAGGFLDSYSYICRGGVFANAQTGNIVLLGISILNGEWLRCIKYLIPIIMFALGILIAEQVRKKFSKSVFHWRQLVVIIEAVILIVAAFLPQGKLDNVANIMISFVCSLQVQSFRTVNSMNFTTTMCTGNLRTATENLYKYSSTKQKEYLISALSLYGIIGFFILGVIEGAAVSNRLGVLAAFVPVGVLAIVFVLMFVDNENKNIKK